MVPRDIFVYLSAALLVVTACTHSFLGEQKLVKPLLSQRDGILKHELARWVFRFAWHVTSLAWVLLALILVVFVVSPANAMRTTLLFTGLVFAGSGIFDGFVSRGRHLGWWLLTLIGVFALCAFFTSA